jgi:hypothetical protein
MGAHGPKRMRIETTLVVLSSCTEKSSTLKGTVSEDGYFLESLNVLTSTYCVYKLMVFSRSFKSFSPFYNN